MQLGFVHPKVKNKWATGHGCVIHSLYIYIFYTKIIKEILLLATNDKNKTEVIKIMENKRKKRL